MASLALDNFRPVLCKQSSLARSTSPAQHSALDSADQPYGVFSIEVRNYYDYKYIEGQEAVNILMYNVEIYNHS